MKSTMVLGSAGVLAFVLNNEILALVVLLAALIVGGIKFAKAAVAAYERRYDDAES